jgi:hypothetical protein
MYENVKYKILNIKNTPGPNFEVVIQWLAPVSKIEHVFLNDAFLAEDLLIQRIDEMWELNYNKSIEEIADKKAKIATLVENLTEDAE